MGLLQIVNLYVSFPTKAGVVQTSNGVNLEIEEGESLCLVGETGCGKTVVALSIIRLLPSNAIMSGEIWFKGKNLLVLPGEEIRRIRGREIGMIFEQPWTCLNPVFTIGDQIAEAIQVHEKCSKKEAKENALELMNMVGIPSPRKRYSQYPHEFSGGMQQRVMISMALALRPSLLIADEPTTALDVTVQAQVVELLQELILGLKPSLFLITHDLGVARKLCKKAAVMYAGEIVEQGKLKEVFEEPKHPYTRLLLQAISDDGFHPIKGMVPELTRLPLGCRFHPRCPYTREICRKERPEIKNGVRCWLWKS